MLSRPWLAGGLSWVGMQGRESMAPHDVNSATGFKPADGRQRYIRVQSAKIYGRRNVPETLILSIEKYKEFYLCSFESGQILS
jgi:hypothetical protein